MESVCKPVISITGIGLVSPLGLDAEQTWRGVLASRPGLGNMPALEQALPSGKDGGQAVDLPPDFAPELPREARYLRFAIEAALRSANVLHRLPCPAHRACYMLGTTLHGMRAAGRFLRSGDPAQLQDFLAGDTLRRATQHLPIAGGSTTTCSACSSSLGSIALGVTLLQTGAADLVVAGGYDAVSEYVWAGFNALRLVSDAPLRPFTRGRTGMKLSEAYAIVILQRAADATHSFSDVAGWGESADAHHLTQPHPTGEGALSAMRQALDRAALSPNDLGLISAHATGTPDNDASEAAALAALLGNDNAHVPVVGFKSHLGHTLGGAGAAELILSAFALRDQIVPPTANVSHADIEYPALRLQTGAAEHRPIGHTLNTSLGFGGANTCVVLRRAVEVDVSRESAPANITLPRSVAITGIGILLPGVTGKSEFLNRLRGNATFDPTATIADADFQHLLNVRRLRRMSAYVKMTLAAVMLACDDARFVMPFEAACVLGTTHGSAHFSHEYYGQVVRDGLLAANPSLFAEGVPNAAAAQLSLMLGLKQSAQTIIGTRTAGLDALRLAALRIASGACARVIVSAGEESYPAVNNAYTSCGLRAARSGDAGFLNGPGAVALILEDEGAARARGATLYARVAASLAASGPRERVVDTIARAYLPSDTVVGSANRTWVDRAEALALRKREHVGTVLNFYDQVGELFSAQPLVSLAAVALSTHVPNFTVLTTDFTGLATSVRLERP